MTKPLVSIGMPVWNGEAYVAKTIESILGQTYKNLELIILDNLSTDRTSEICLRFAERDSRLRYILDSEPRDVPQAHRKIAQLVLGDYFMFACDDDEYEPVYLERLTDLLLNDSTVGLAYSGWGLLYSDGTKVPEPHRAPFKASNSKFFNFSRYLFFRRPIPISFGVIRTKLHQAALAYFVRPDQRGWDHDNLYMLRLLSMAKVDYCPDQLFYYRVRDREALYRLRGQYHQPDGALKSYLNRVLHLMSVKRAVSAIIHESGFSGMQQGVLLVLNHLAFLEQIRPLRSTVNSLCKMVWKAVSRA